jgi:Holliday junction resolvasome RuvABC endonuclease subunit
MARNKIVVGLDAGFAACGLVAVDVGENKVIDVCAIETKRTAKKRGIRVSDDDCERCASMVRTLNDFLTKHKPKFVVVEMPSGGAKGARAQHAMGMAKGMVTATLTMMDLPCLVVTPLDVKRVAVPAGGKTKSVEKEAVATAARKALNWKDAERTMQNFRGGLHEHIYDAAGAVLAAEHDNMMRFLKGALRES